MRGVALVTTKHCDDVAACCEVKEEKRKRKILAKSVLLVQCDVMIMLGDIYMS